MVELIDRFINRFGETSMGRDLESQERALLEEALSDFLLDEQWLRHGRADREIGRTLGRLRREMRAFPRAKQIYRQLDGQIDALTARLERSEAAALVMREHLTMMSDNHYRQNLK